MNKFINLCVIIVAMVMTFALTSCDKDAPDTPTPIDPSNPFSGKTKEITLTINKPKYGSVDGKDMKLRVYFVSVDSLVKTVSSGLKIGDNKITVPVMNYTSIIVTTHDYSDYESTSNDIKFPKVLTMRNAVAYLPTYSTRHILFWEDALNMIVNTNTNKIVAQLQDVSKLIMVKKTINVKESPYIRGAFSKITNFRIVKDSKNQEWYALYRTGTVDVTTVYFQMGISTDIIGETQTIPVNANILPGEVFQYTTLGKGKEPITETLNFSNYSHASVMASTANWYTY